MPDGLAEHLAAQLPAPLVGRISLRTGDTEEAAVHQAAAVLEALDAAVPRS